MKRVVTALMLTAAGLVMLLRYTVPPLPPAKVAIAAVVPPPHVVAAAPPRPKAAAPGPTATPRPSATPSAAPPRVLAVAAPAPTRAPTAPPPPRRTPPPAPAPSRTYTGISSAACNYGSVVVQITVQGGRITDAQAPTYPSDRQQSRDINSWAIPQYDQETVQAQSANIDSVSGATCTWDGYKASLQSAIDQWKPGG
jgi:uncharacterized protein with FMN-binding domain